MKEIYGRLLIITLVGSLSLLIRHYNGFEVAVLMILACCYSYLVLPNSPTK